jgi:N-methylhydantoinase B
VVADLRAGYVTPAHAEAAYGVVLTDDGQLDEELTRARQEEIRRWRIGRAPDFPLMAPEFIGITVQLRDGQWRCASCETELGDDWRTGACFVETEISERYAQLHMPVTQRTTAPRIMMREHYCPGCALSLGVDVVAEGTPRLASPQTSAEPLVAV